MLVLANVKCKTVIEVAVVIVALVALGIGLFTILSKPAPYKQMTITQQQQFLNDQGYPVAIDGKLTVNGDGETETAWNEFIEFGRKEIE